MAWQNEQTWFTYSSNIRLIGNISPSTITHTGTNLRVQGMIAAGARGSNNYSFYYLDYTSYAQPEGGSKIALGAKGRTWKVGSEDVHVSFDVTLTNVPAAATSKTFSVNFYGPNTNSVKATLYWTINFSASGNKPSDYSVADIIPDWDRITFTSIVGNTGGLNLTEHSPSVRMDATHVAATPKYQDTRTGSNVSATITTTITNGSSKIYNPTWTIQGCGYYYCGAWVINPAGEMSPQGQGSGTYTPPAPCTMTYTDPGGEGTKVYPVVFSGDAAKNRTDYDTAELKRTVRYKVEGAADWTYVENAAEALVDAQTTFNVSVPGSKNATIEGWMTYHGLQSEVKTITVYNGNPPSRVYGSVEGQSKLCTKMYGSVGGTSVEIVKLYGSVNGKSKSILG